MLLSGRVAVPVCLWLAPLAPRVSVSCLLALTAHLTPGLRASHTLHTNQAQLSPTPSLALLPAHTRLHNQHHTSGLSDLQDNPQARGYLQPPPGQAVRDDDEQAAVRGGVRRVQASNRCLLTLSTG